MVVVGVVVVVEGDAGVVVVAVGEEVGVEDRVGECS